MPSVMKSKDGLNLRYILDAAGVVIGVMGRCEDMAKKFGSDVAENGGWAYCDLHGVYYYNDTMAGMFADIRDIEF